MQLNITNKIMKAWYEMLHNNISVPVYRVDAPASEEGNYVLLRIESVTDRTNNSKFVTYPVLITEVVTRFKAAIDDGVAADIDNEISNLLFPSNPGQIGLVNQTDIQITEVKRVNQTYIPEDDGTFRYNRLVTRNVHRVVQTSALGAELITNGSFSGNASGWSLGGGWIYDTNKVTHNTGNSVVLLQVGTLDDTKTYRVSLNISGTNGFVGVYLGNGSTASAAFVAGEGDVYFDSAWFNGATIIEFHPDSTFNGSITNVSVKEIL